ncbi:MAG: hypothetical protein AB2989_04660 [Candidatus Symbiodolus clandestinus]
MIRWLMMSIKPLLKKVKNLTVPPRPNSIPASAPPLTISHTPDIPQSFGYKTAWMAIKTVDTNSVIKALEDLNFSNRQVANWDTGLQAAYSHNKKYQHEHLFISPPLVWLDLCCWICP